MEADLRDKRTADELAVLKSLRISGPISLEDLRQHAGGVSRERVRQLIRKTGDTQGCKVCSVDPVSLLRTIRARPDITNIWQLTKKLRGGYRAIMICLLELGVDRAVERLFRLRKYRRQKLKEEEMLTHLRELSTKLGKTAGAQDVNRTGKFCQMTYQKYFGGMQNAQRLAGLTPNKTGRRSHTNSSINQ